MIRYFKQFPFREQVKYFVSDMNPHFREAEQKLLPDRFRKYFKRSKYLLKMNRLALMFEIAPRLADAYRLKNEFIAIMRSENSQTGREKLTAWLFQVELLEMDEFRSCVSACRNWFQEILNSMDYPWTNGFTEGCNNKTKVLKRTCYGVKSFNRFRNRILHCAT